VLPRIKQIVELTYEAVHMKINRFDKKFMFEIFGYDFILDQAFKTWLLEVNTNPCLELSSPLLR